MRPMTCLCRGSRAPKGQGSSPALRVLIVSQSAVASSKRAFDEWKQVSAWERKAMLVNVRQHPSQSSYHNRLSGYASQHEG